MDIQEIALSLFHTSSLLQYLPCFICWIFCFSRYAELCPPVHDNTDDVSISLGILKGADIEGFGLGRSKVSLEGSI